MPGELDDYARAVVEGRTDVPVPESLRGRRLRVEYDRSADGGYRSAPGAEARLRIRVSYAGGWTLVMWPLGLGAPVALAWAWWIHRQSSASWLFALSALLVVPYALHRILALFDRLEITASRTTLRVQRSRFWPRFASQVPVAEIAQLFVVGKRDRYALCVRRLDGKALLLAPAIDSPARALYLERQIELAMGLGDAPVERALTDRAAARVRLYRWRSALFEVLLLALLLVGTAFGARSCGRTLTELAVGDEPREGGFEIDRPSDLFFTASLEFTKAEWRYLKDVPRSLRFELEVLRDGRPVNTLRCDPFDMFIWSSSTTNKRYTSLNGSLNHCELRLPAGRYMLRVRRVWDEQAPRVALDESTVTARADY